ncbi:MAG TPA: RsiV family protein [Paludibacter sp.]|nr:RsiV family protein [Paludibacter sp.]
MKRQSILLLMSVLVSTFFFSCTSKTVKTEEKDLTKRYYLTKDTTKGWLNVDIEVEIPTQFADSNVLKSIRATIISNLFGDEYISQPNDSLVPFFAKELLTDYRENNEPLINELDSTSHYSFNNEHTVSGFSLLSDKNIYAYGVERYVYMGGAHGMETKNFYNFDLKTGKLITEKDLFKDNFESELAKLMKVRIIEESKEYKDEKNSEPITDLEDTDFWTDSIKSNGNFYITDEGINYVFNPYEIAPYYMGQTEVTLPFSRLKNLLKPNSLVAYLVEKQAKQ